MNDDDRTARLELSGDLDVYRRDEIARSLPPVQGLSRLVLDMRNATLIDSSVVAVLMRYRRSFIDAGGDGHDIVLVVPPKLRRIFEITGLVSLLTIVSGPPEPAEQQQPAP